MASRFYSRLNIRLSTKKQGYHSTCYRIVPTSRTRTVTAKLNWPLPVAITFGLCIKSRQEESNWRNKKKLSGKSTESMLAETCSWKIWVSTECIFRNTNLFLTNFLFNTTIQIYLNQGAVGRNSKILGILGIWVVDLKVPPSALWFGRIHHRLKPCWICKITRQPRWMHWKATIKTKICFKEGICKNWIKSILKSKLRN